MNNVHEGFFFQLKNCSIVPFLDFDTLFTSVAFGGFREK